MSETRKVPKDNKEAMKVDAAIRRLVSRVEKMSPGEVSPDILSGLSLQAHRLENEITVLMVKSGIDPVKWGI